MQKPQIADRLDVIESPDAARLLPMSDPAKMSRPTAEGLAMLDELAAALDDERVPFERSQMFGSPGPRLPGKGKFFVSLVDGDELIFKLDGDAHAAALALPGAHLFAPMEGRPMKQWVQLGPAHRRRFAEFAAAAARGLA